MNIETDEGLSCKLELCCLLDEGRVAIEADKKRPLHEVMNDIKQKIMEDDIESF